MLSRRDLVRMGVAAALTTGASALGVSLGACARSKTVAWPRRTKYEGVDFIELFPGDADESAPLVVFIHGMGDKPDSWIDTWRTFPAKAQIVLPRAFTKYGDGWSWFEFRDGMTDAEFGAEVGGAEEKLWKAIAKLAGPRRLIVSGFSQGGILSFAMAARHPDKIAYAFPVSGSCPGPLLPKNKAHAAPLIAFHGTADNVLAFKWGQGAVDAFKEQGNEASLKAYPGVGHTMTAAMRADLWTELQKALPLTRS
jgi:phospholipase/carboxylesterase